MKRKKESCTQIVIEIDYRPLALAAFLVNVTLSMRATKPTVMESRIASTVLDANLHSKLHPTSDQMGHTLLYFNVVNSKFDAQIICR